MNRKSLFSHYFSTKSPIIEGSDADVSSIFGVELVATQTNSKNKFIAYKNNFSQQANVLRSSLPVKGVKHRM